MKLRGAVALVTGGAVRVGRAIAVALADRGATVAMTYRTSSVEAEAVVRSIRKRGRKALAIRADQSDIAQIRAAVRTIERQFGRIDVLVNSASNFYPTPFLTATAAQWDDLHAVNLRAPFFWTQAVAPGMARRRRGVVVNIADVSAFNPWTAYLPYCVAKAGVVALTRGLAKALAPHVRVNAVAPGPILPPPGLSRAERRRAAAKTLLKRWGSPDDIARTVLYLVEGSDFVTGQVIAVDGGRLLS
ncbi:MAG: SDR family oxidoreductase [Candidatus Omnitrophica bacterium]|nr:SDR family oxidoreductase [Candidatus Omnitrophota bacterium]